MRDDLASGNVPRRSLQVDVAKYQAMIDDPSLTVNRPGFTGE